MNKIVLSILVFSSMVCFGQQLTNSNFELWTTENYGSEPNNWEYNDGTSLVYGTNNYFRGLDGVDPLTTTKITGSGAFGGSGSSVLLETKAAIGTTLLSNGYTTIPGYLYRQEAITNTNVGSITFNYKSTVIQGDSCFVKVGLIDANNNLITYGEFWIKPSENSTTWKTKTIVLQNLLPGTPTEIFIEAMSTYDEAYAYNTPIIGSKLYLDNFTLNYCNTPITTNLTETVCDYMLPYTWNGLTFTGAGVQSATLQSSLGCDSTVNITLNVISGPFTQIPDPVFEQRLINLGYDPCGIVDGQVPTNNINNVLSLTIYNTNITDLTGIEAFSALQSLDLYANLQVNGINLTSNTQLTDLTIDAKLSSLNLSQNLLLQQLYLNNLNYTNEIQILDLSSNTLIQNVDCKLSGINTLILPQSQTLTSLDCRLNNINSLDLSSVPNLQTLNASDNILINLGTNTHNSLEYLDCKNNSFSGLNLSGFNQLKYLDCSDNSLECLNAKNGINNQFIYLNTKNNFTLTCIEVDDSLYSANNPIWNANKDTWSSYSEDCQGVCVTADISEVIIEKIIIYPNPTNGIINIQAESNIKEITLLDVAGKTLGKFKANSVDLSEFASGTYMLNIRYANDFEVSKQIIKN